MRIVAVGKLRVGAEADLYNRYAMRIRPVVTLIEIPEASGAPAEAKRREAAAMLDTLPSNAFAVALDLAGEAPDSRQFATLLERWLGLSKPLCFLIGGAEGLDRSAIDRADHLLSLGPLTWPHFMVRAMLAEQLYRARSIAAGHPYHRTGRP